MSTTFSDARVGNGVDVHAFATRDGGPLILGGVIIPEERRLRGHSDADVLAHAISDALLGAGGLGDLGRVFGVDDPDLIDADSMLLLDRVVAEVDAAGFAVGNVDATIIAERPRLGRYLPAMRDNLADALAVDSTMVSVKATTTDGLGVIGRGEGIAATAVCLLSPAH